MAKTPIAIVTADNHLRPVTWNKHPDLRDDAYAAFEQVTSLCLKHSVPMIQLGDLFDRSYPDSLSVSVYMQQMERLAKADLRMWYIEGNHDAATVAWASLAPNAFAAASFELAGIDFYGLDFVPASRLEHALGFLPNGVNVLLTHQAWADVQPIGHTDGSFSMIPYGLLLMTGDYHVTQRYEGRAKDGGAITAYSFGSTAMQKLNESPDKFVGLLYDDLSVELCQLDTRRFNFVELRAEEDLDAFIQQSQREGVFDGPRGKPQDPRLQRPILRVKYADNIPDAFNRLTAACGQLTHLFLEPQNTAIDEIVDVAATPEGAFDTLVTAIQTLAADKSTVKSGAERLLRATDRKAELLKLFNEFQESFQPVP